MLQRLDETIDPSLLMSRYLQKMDASTEPVVDDWQRNLLNSPRGRVIFALCSRQVGKSTAASVLGASELAAGRQSVIVAKTLRQAELILKKVVHVYSLIEGAKPFKRQTLTELETEDATLVCVAAGTDGGSARGFTVNGLLLFDEACFFEGGDATFRALMPLAHHDKGARTVFLSTPGHRDAFASRVWLDPDGAYRHVHRITARSVDIPRMAAYVAEQKRAMPPADFEVEHGLAWRGDGRPYFDQQTIDDAFKGIPPLEFAGDICHGTNLSS